MLILLDVYREDLENFGLPCDVIDYSGREAVTEQPLNVIDEVVDDFVGKDCYSFLTCVDDNFGVDGDVEAENIT